VSVDLWLVRHGETGWSAERRFCGWSDPPLSHRGREQAAALRPHLLGVRFDSVVSSTSLRAVETARLAHGEPRRDARLRELDFGDIEGMSWMGCPPEIRSRLLDFENFEAPNGESVVQMGRRVTEAVEELEPGSHLIVTHGGVIRFLLGRAGVERSIPLASVNPVRVSPGPPSAPLVVSALDELRVGPA